MGCRILALAMIMQIYLPTSYSMSFFMQRVMEPANSIPSAARILSESTERQLDCASKCSQVPQCNLLHLNNSQCILYNIDSISYSIPTATFSPSSANSQLMWKVPACARDKKFTVLMNAYIYEGAADTSYSQTFADVVDDSVCYNLCIETYGSSCNFLSYSDEDRTCVISSRDFYDSWTLSSWTAAASSCYRSRSEKWKMVYHRPKQTKTGYAQEVTGPWLDDLYYTNISLPSGDDSVVLKNPLVYYWSYLNITKVRIGVYKDGQEQQHVVFDGVGSTVQSWMQYSRIINSSWTDMGAGQSFVEFDWTANGISGRSVYMAMHYEGCSNDWIWMMFNQDQIAPVCTWTHIPDADVPQLVFSNSSTAVHTDDLVEGDYMRIHVMFP